MPAPHSRPAPESRPAWPEPTAVPPEPTAAPPPRAAPHWSVHLPAGVPADGVDLAAGGTLTGAWSAAWASAPDREVLRGSDGTRVSAAELADRVDTAARRYAAAGLSPGDRVLISAGTGLDLVVSYLGALRYGLAVVPTNTAYTGPELAHVLADSAPAAAVLDDPDRLRQVPETAVPAVLTGPDLAGLPRPAGGTPPDRNRPGDTALIVYTSGTTGVAKGAVLSHANLLASAHSVRLAWRWQSDDRLVLCLPLFHVHGLAVGLHGTLLAGASAVLHPRFDPAAVAGAIADNGATLFFGVPTMYHRLAASPHLAGLRPLRLAVSGSAPLPADLHAAVAEGSGQRVLERYGMTETIMLVSNPYEGERRPGTVGFPLPGVDVRLLPGKGGVSEIAVRGPNVIRGYHQRPDATAAAFTPDGWFLTGDLGTLDDDGYLRISGRAKELIITGGFNVYPREIEETLRAHPDVADAAVVGAPSSEWGEIVIAFVVPRDRLDTSTLAARLTIWCGERLAPYKCPRGWEWINTVPRNALGKILRHQLMP